MTRTILTAAAAFLLLLVLVVGGCDKERIVETTEYIEQTEYIEMPPDTVFQTDTVIVNDSVTVQSVDTVHVYDTIQTVNTVHDTTYIHDTISTVQHHYDTVTVTVNHYDTVTVTDIDTVVAFQCDPNASLAMAALQHYSNPLVLEIINAEFQLTNGWIFYLSTIQCSVTGQSTTTYDIYGYINFWTEDFAGYYQLEYNWRMTHTGGDPDDVNNWNMAEPPTASSVNVQPGLRASSLEKISSQLLR